MDDMVVGVTKHQETHVVTDVQVTQHVSYCFCILRSKVLTVQAEFFPDYLPKTVNG